MVQGQPVDGRRVAAALAGRSVVLVGMMGAGKTSVGKRLAAKLGLPFVDADAEIEAGAQLTIAEIFDRFGEAYFRDGERKVIARLLSSGQQVLATGGGAFMNAMTRQNISARGVSIWLKPDVEVLLARVRKKSNRPLLKTDDPERTLRRLLEERSSTYGLADITIESRDGPHDMVVDMALRRMAEALGCAVEPGAPERRKVDVPLGGRAYSILIGPGLIDEAGAEIAKIAPEAKCAIVTDANVAPLYLDRIKASLEKAGLRSVSIVCPPGEASKSFAEFARVSDALIEARVERRDVVVALGGGVVGGSGRILCGVAEAGRALRPGPDHASGAGRFQRRRQDGHQLAPRQEPCRRVPSALARSCRHERSRLAERKGVSRRLRRGGQVRPHR